MSALHIEVVRPQDLTPGRVQRWSELQGQQADSAYDSPFLSPHWARAVERAQARTGGGARGVRVAVVTDGAQDLGFMAAHVGGATALPAGAPFCDYQGLVAAPGVEIDARAIVSALRVQRLDFCHMLDGSGPFQGFSHGESVSHVIEIGEGYETYAAERRAAGVGLLKDCDKKRRKAQREQGEVVFTAFNRSSADYDQLIAWKRAQLRATGQFDIFQPGWTRRLLADLFESRDPDFGATLFTLHIGGALAAAHLHLRSGRTIHGWLIAHNPAFERASPGLLLFQDILRWMDTTPYSRLDLGAGDYRFKRELANAEVRVGHGFVGVLSPATLLRQAAYSLRRAAEALPLGAASELPGKAMRRVDRLRGLRSA
ncbi:GNAT family N-acetyltransferase [Phenylobacterium sp.]|uniref:GNAT family N-acetyltransferase n=1 Tax=Phenylobacterium sp. TaxID=1871053 RepID=UPI00260C489D|nr:GNAT family N-acetyltransferase [Phenylobacterium sp.]